MTYTLNSITTVTVGLALDFASMRHQTIANNIANINTQGYIPVQVRSGSFAEQLEQLSNSFEFNTHSLQSIGKLELEPILDEHGNPMKIELDSEVAKMTQNSVHYQALIKALNRHYAILNSAVSDGKK